MISLRQFIFESRKTFKVYIMVGLPGSGKSTWIKNNLPENIEILSKDLIRQDLGIIKDQNIKAIGNKEQEKEVKSIYHDKLLELLNKEEDFVIDNTNIGHTLIHIFNQIHKHNKYNHNCETVGVNLKTPVEVCQKHRENIPKKVYDDMLKELRYLTDKDCDKIINVEYKDIKESIDNNLNWKIDKYFERAEVERKQFYDLVDFCRENPAFNKKDLEEYLKDHEFKNLKKFVDFIDDVIKQDTEGRDYVYILMVAIKLVINSDKECLKYTNKKENT